MAGCGSPANDTETKESAIDHDAIKNAEIRIAEVQAALADVQRVLAAAQRVQDTAEKSIKIVRPVAITVACGVGVFAVVVAIRERTTSEHHRVITDPQRLIRPARADDAPAVTQLLAQLGYPDGVSEVGARRRGLASALLEDVESIAIRTGCCRLEVTTQVHRVDAGGFYAAFGFKERPRRLVKPLVRA